MSRRTERHLSTDSIDIFRAFTDLMSNAFMIISFFLVLSLVQAMALNKKLKTASPIIIDEHSGKFKFQSGSADLTPELKQYIAKDVIPKITSITQQQDIAFIQVIGHTDGQANNQVGNLDQALEKTAQGQQSVSVLKPGSNADLGLMRAIAVTQALQKSGRLKKVSFQAYSAAQLYLPSGKLAPLNRGAEETRRRIEIRFVPPGQEK
jgi:outer membrane protein OmpA-like peptidoglycan-associated protein